MPTYGKNNFKESNVNYLNKDFTSIKTALMDYAKSYFPDSYRDFNETSPGMMLLEMNAYVGDVLSFYIDKQYQEMLLPLAEERRNIITMAKMFGYKVKPIVPAYVDLTFTSNVNASSTDASKVDYSNAGIFNPKKQVVSSNNTDIIFSTLEHVDFRISGSNDTEIISSTADSGLATSYQLSRTVKAISATEKSLTFQIGSPEKFKKITIPDTNVIDIISCVDSNNNNWYEVDFLAQDKVPIQTHYTEDDRPNAYTDLAGVISETPVPFSLTYITTTKRFTRETNLNNTTSLIFGNGVLKNGQVVDDGFIDLEQLGVVIPGQTNDLNDSIDPLLGDEYSTLGETPNNTTLTITYRVGGGIDSNVAADDLTTAPTDTAENGNTDAEFVSVTNQNPAVGGKDEEDTIEIKEKAKAFFSTQNRCVTKEDYEARVLNIPAKFGNIAKAYVSNIKSTQKHNLIPDYAQYLYYDKLISNGTYSGQTTGFLNMIQILEDLRVYAIENRDDFGRIYNYMVDNIFNGDINVGLGNYANSEPYKGLFNKLQSAERDYTNQQTLVTSQTIEFPIIEVYALAYNNLKQLVGNPHADTTRTTDNLPSTLTENIKLYLEQFKIMTDSVVLADGYVVNFGVFFDVIAEKYADKQQVKLRCIDTIEQYFRVEKMQFNQPIYKSQLEFELMGVEGVRSIGHVTITQEKDYFYDDITSDGDENTFENATYSYSYDSDINGGDGGFIADDEGTVGFGYKYDFNNALSSDGTIILPPLPSTPTVFELKQPNTYIQGRVR
jgi:hypothetical protein